MEKRDDMLYIRFFIIFIRIFGKGDQNAARYFMEKYSEKITLREGTNF